MGQGPPYLAARHAEAERDGDCSAVGWGLPHQIASRSGIGIGIEPNTFAIRGRDARGHNLAKNADAGAGSMTNRQLLPNAIY